MPRCHPALLLALLAASVPLVGGTAAADPAAYVRTITEGPSGTPLGLPTSLADGNHDDLFVGDNNGRIVHLELDGTYLNEWSEQVSGPTDVEVSADDIVYVSNTSTSTVQRYDPDGTWFGGWGGSGTLAGQFDNPAGIGLDAAGNVYVADLNNDRIEKFTPTGDLIRTWGTTGTGSRQFDAPTDVAVGPDGHVVVADAGNSRVQVFTANGAFLDEWDVDDGDAGIAFPVSIDVDPEGQVFVAGDSQVNEYAGDGTYLQSLGASPVGDLLGPADVNVDDVGGVLAADAIGTQVQVYRDATAPTAAITTPTDGAVVRLGQPLVADFSCNDDTGGSGIDECNGDVPDGSLLDTSTEGESFFNVAAIDRAGLVDVESNSYTVVAGKPDAEIRRGTSGAFLGGNTYNANGAGQAVTGSAAVNRSVTYRIRVGQDSDLADQVRLKGQGSSGAFTVTYLGPTGANITSQVVAGTYVTPSGPSGTPLATIRAVVTPTRRTGAASLARTLTATSVGDPTHRDVVRFTTRRT